MDDPGANEDWEQRLSALEPPERVVAQAILAGADAASCALLEQDGALGYITWTGEDAKATVKFRLSGDSEVRVRCLPLAWVAKMAAEGAIIEEVSAPEPDSLTWTAAAWAITETPPVGLVLPQYLQGPSRWLVRAQDDRGLAAGPLSKIRMPDGRPLGNALTAFLAKTTIKGANERMNAARRELGDNFTAIAASSAGELLHDVAAVAGADGGPAMIEWQVLRCALTGGAWQRVAGAPARLGIPPSHRRNRLFDAILKAAEADAFGTGIDSPRGIRETVSLDQPIGDPARGATIGERLSGSPGVASGIEMDDLLALAGLTKREREVFERLVDGFKQVEIAELLGIAPGTVAALSSRAKDKVRRARAAT